MIIIPIVLAFIALWHLDERLFNKIQKEFFVGLIEILIAFLILCAGLIVAALVLT
ncbi:hypothetical protein SAMN02745131_01075 [Flavisolibacter ginsengisoli DSM 18119]|uniref:Uncharacterized protein n=1 Tax=Flavisolibacter ginsengisoli DSM 18119 TaxID=1121884 RepID=A0A1M4W3J3_9BACT|nr:hypothetical protein SAMN02745131_01075 [Flavisolibacter ginsengisoli DSM 18119]